ncbi:hypothetical protein Bca101_086549 [Brassica carinata]
MLQFWEAGKAQRGDELMGVDMLLFDVKGSSPGCGFDITRCNQNFRLSDSLMTILFSDSTNLDVLTEPYSPIPVKRFSNTTHQTIAGTSLSGRHQETLGIKVFKGGQEAT